LGREKSPARLLVLPLLLPLVLALLPLLPQALWLWDVRVLSMLLW
jgi:hypothetical protein